MNSESLLFIFIALRLSQQVLESILSYLNKKTYENKNLYENAAKVLKIGAEDMKKTLTYTRDKSRFNAINSWISVILTLLFYYWGGLGFVEQTAKGLSSWLNGGDIITGLLFLGILALLSGLMSLPFELFFTFVIEEKHGFNRQTLMGFFMDRVKGLIIGSILGGLLLSGILWIMSTLGESWWIAAWLAVFGFSLLTIWIYPTLLAPLFNKFTPIKDGELKDKIFALAEKVDFQAGDISVMDASTRSSHGNAYFTGVFGKKKIVLFDTLIKSMSADEIVAVMAHELGHFKLNHIRWSLIRSFFMTGIIFFLMSLCLPIQELYTAFSLSGISNYGALLVFSLWFGPLGFLLQPVTNLISRKNEFEADAFALANIDNKRLLGNALLKLRENSHVMPISHDLFSSVYHSHPPILVRLKAMGYI